MNLLSAPSIAKFMTLLPAAINTRGNRKPPCIDYDGTWMLTSNEYVVALSIKVPRKKQQRELFRRRKKNKKKPRSQRINNKWTK
jgi:hypothetical protein